MTFKSQVIQFFFTQPARFSFIIVYIFVIPLTPVHLYKPASAESVTCRDVTSDPVSSSAPAVGV